MYVFAPLLHVHAALISVSNPIPAQAITNNPTINSYLFCNLYIVPESSLIWFIRVIVRHDNLANWQLERTDGKLNSIRPRDKENCINNESEKSRHTGSTAFKEYVLQQGCKCILYFFLEGHMSDHVNIFIGHNRKLVGQHSTYKQAFEKIFLSAPKKCQGSFYFPDQRWDSNFFSPDIDTQTQTHK